MQTGLSLILSIRAMYCVTRGATLSFSSASAGAAASHSAEGITPSNLCNSQRCVSCKNSAALLRLPECVQYYKMHLKEAGNFAQDILI